MLIKWECCVICHVRNIKRLCPTKGKVQAGSGYHNFTKNVKNFIEMSSWPVDIDPDQLDDGEGIETVLRNHSASWQKLVS